MELPAKRTIGSESTADGSGELGLQMVEPFGELEASQNMSGCNLRR
ncbi:hypothetical protein SynRCC2555_00247 [Synechococcus sp. WH 8101]|nr:hypothetical protein SynRCC2555_00247 [Synechococcus sp. WH 8101]